MSGFTTKQVAHLANLANLPLTDQEISSLTKDLEAMSEIMAQIAELDVENIEPTNNGSNNLNVTRDDVVEPSLTQQQALQNATQSYQGYFVVPQVVDRGDN